MLKRRIMHFPLALLFILSLAALLASCTTEERGGVRIYVANEGDGTLSAIDADSFRVINTIQLAGKPHNVNVDPLGRYFYATNHEGEVEEEHDVHAGHIPYLRILDFRDGSLLASVPMEDMAAHVVPSRDGKRVYVSREGGSSVVEVDVEQRIIIRTFLVGEGPHGFVVSHDGQRLYVPNMKSNDVSVVDLSSGKEKRIELSYEGNTCETPVAMGIMPDDSFAFVTCGKSFEVYKIDAVQLNVVDRLQLKEGNFPGPIQIPVHPDGEFLYVPDMWAGVVHKIAADTLDIVKDIPTGKGAHGIAYSADGKRAYVTNTWEDSVSVVDLTKDVIIETIPVGSQPNGIAVSNGKNQGW